MADETHLPINGQLSIPRHELEFHFTPSSGPGGQHANRSATRVELRFDVENSPSLNDAQRHRVKSRLRRYIDKHGILRLVSQESRSQARNRQEATERFQSLMAKALKRRKRRRCTQIPHRERERRLENKRRRSEKKKLRKPPRREER